MKTQESKNTKLQNWIHHIFSYDEDVFQIYYTHLLSKLRKMLLFALHTHSHMTLVHTYSVGLRLRERNAATYTHIYAHAIWSVEFTEDSV